MLSSRSLVSLARTARRPLSLTGWCRGYHPSVLPNLVSTSSPDFQAKAAAMDDVLADLQTKLADARKGGGEREVEKMRKAGKKTPRER